MRHLLQLSSAVLSAALAALACGTTPPTEQAGGSGGGNALGGAWASGGSTTTTPTYGGNTGSPSTGGISNGTGGLLQSAGGAVAAQGGHANGGSSAAQGGKQASGGAASGGSASGGHIAMGGAAGNLGLGGASAGSGGAVTGGAPSAACAPRTTYRNLFAELLGKTEQETDAKLDAAYTSLFGGMDNRTVYYTKGTDEAYILDVNSNDIRSEGLSYGMMIAVQLDKKDVFDRLWRFTKRHLEQSNNYFAWQSRPDGSIISRASAPDGEEYYAQALIFASKRWGDGEDMLNYSAEAKKLLSALINNGNWNRDNYLVNFGNGNNYTDASYMLPAFYQTWACFDEENRDFWEKSIAAARAFFPKTTHATTGLAPNFSNFDGTPRNGSNFQSDAWRVVANIMMDWNFYAADPWQPMFAAKYAAFFASAPRGADQFNLNGQVTHTNGDLPAIGLVAQNALVAFGVPASNGTPFVQALWSVRMPTGQYRYYDGMLYMLGLLHVSGRFHVWY